MNGMTHAAITIGLAGAVLYTCRTLGVPESTTNMVAAGCITGIFVHPDLDQADASRHPSLALWWPYAKLIPHRHPLSHFPILGTFLRTAYLFLIVWIVERTMGIQLQIPPGIEFAFLGLCLADLGHFIADWRSHDLHLSMSEVRAGHRSRSRAGGSPPAGVRVRRTTAKGVHGTERHLPRQRVLHQR